MEIVASRNAFTNCRCINNGCKNSCILFQNYVTDALHQLSCNLAELDYAAPALNIQMPEWKERTKLWKLLSDWLMTNWTFDGQHIRLENRCKILRLIFDLIKDLDLFSQRSERCQGSNIVKEWKGGNVFLKPLPYPITTCKYVLDSVWKYNRNRTQ